MGAVISLLFLDGGERKSVCVCVCVKERKRERKRQMKREGEGRIAHCAYQTEWLSQI